MTTPTECKHGLKHGCVYCHATPTSTPATRPSGPARTGAKRASRSSRLAEQMNDRMTRLNKRLREIRGQDTV